MKKIAVFPGSYDPFTVGHQEIVDRGLDIFDEIIVALGVNESKKYMFTTESRLAHINAIYKDEERVKVAQFKGLTVNLCKEQNANFLLRGIRNVVDLEYERAIANMNKDMTGIETVFLLADPSKAMISSSIVRELYKNGANIASYVTKQEVLVINKK
ncbi:MAG: pantetheine-phosphate adenylyltransferase [Crocinitomicaceae bacterium]|nr:pantetheine-phosphate adenylyltransferase [Crocinitomicaceae bacterium]